jgi:hypothetical protein
MQLRYMGFDQTKNIREYRFDGVAAGQTAKYFVVSADLALFVRSHVALQEGAGVVLKETCCRSRSASATTARTYRRRSGRLRIGSSCCCGRAKD